ncbi:MAG: FecR protein [Sphingobacteriales bacterium]|nr:FecR protein [Sphingobacteriales bacterium]
MEDFKEMDERIYNLIISELEGELSPEEATILEDWRSSAEENEKVFKEMRLVHETLNLIPEYQTLDENSSWISLSKKLKSSPNLKIEGKERTVRLRYLRWLSSAAAIILVMSISFYFYNSFTVVNMSTGLHERKNILLPDGSAVYLNENTSISYSKSSFKEKRVLSMLKGEAFFDVIHNSANTFRVDAGEIQIKDIGTSFNVTRSEENVSVIVNKGIVNFEHVKSKKSEILKAKNKAVYDVKTQKIIRSQNTNLNYRYYMDGNFTFLNTPLSEVVQILEKFYGKTIVIKNKELKNRKLTANLHKQPLDSILNIITQTLLLKTSKQNNVIYIYK